MKLCFFSGQYGTYYGNEIEVQSNTLPENQCNITSVYNSDRYTIILPQQAYFVLVNFFYEDLEDGSLIDLVGQFSEVALYDGEVFIGLSPGSLWLNTGNPFKITLPLSMPGSNCYTIRIKNGYFNNAELYISEPFTGLN